MTHSFTPAAFMSTLVVPVMVLLGPLIGDDVAADQNRAEADIDHAGHWHWPECDNKGSENSHELDHIPAYDGGAFE